MEVLYEYFASGIVESGIRQFGGEDCFNEIPAFYHWMISLVFGSLSVFLTWLWRDDMAHGKGDRKRLAPNCIEQLCFWVGLLSFLFTFYYKIITKRGFFILNPCHITLIFELILLAAKDNTNVFLRRLHVAWSAWLFGAFAALILPHLEEIDVFEFVLYYLQHLVILPIGPLILYRRYGCPMPGFKNHVAGFGTNVTFQFFLLVPIGRFLKVNLNFAICHSPYEPYYPLFGYHYLVAEVFNLCLIAYLLRWANYLYVNGLYWLGRKLFAPQIEKEQ